MGVKNFRNSTILCFYHDAFLLLHHDIYVCTAMPSFDAPRYLCLHHDALLLSLHDTFIFAQTPFAQNANTVVQRRDIGSMSFELPQNMARCTALKLNYRCPVRLQHGVINFQLTTASFVFSHHKFNHTPIP